MSKNISLVESWIMIDHEVMRGKVFFVTESFGARTLGIFYIDYFHRSSRYFDTFSYGKHSVWAVVSRETGGKMILKTFKNKKLSTAYLPPFDTFSSSMKTLRVNSTILVTFSRR